MNELRTLEEIRDEFRQWQRQWDLYDKRETLKKPQSSDDFIKQLKKETLKIWAKEQGKEISELATFTKKDVETIIEANDNPKEPNEALKDAAIEHGAFGEVDKFNEWMLKIQNKYYSNHQAMTEAYKKINNEKI